jgi:NADPH:quinone reductase-like Zn-dependent oxidoreductase
MKALRLHELGGPEQLRVDEIDRPAIREDEALVRIRAAALNRRDLFITQGLYPNVHLPVTLGADGAGEIAQLGAVDGGLRVGDEVVIDPMLGWGDDPRVWDAAASSILGMPRDGTFAGYVAVPAANVYRKPAGLSMEEAAAIPLAGLTAFRAVFTRGALQPGETVLVTGVGGGVQTFVLLFAKRAGARAIVTDVTINSATSPDWAKTLRAMERVDLVVDSSGGDTLRTAIDVVRPGGRIAIYGGTNGNASIKMFPLFWKHLTILGTSMGSPEDFAAMLRLFDGALRPAIDRAFALEDATAAFARLAESSQFGKIVLTLSD